MPMRTFTLNSPEAYEALCPNPDRPWIPNGALPREPRWPRPLDTVQVMSIDDDDPNVAVREWMEHLEAGRLGK